MKVRYINFETEIYTVYLDSICSNKPQLIDQDGNKIRVKRNYRWLIGQLDDTLLKDEINQREAYLNFSDAQKKQLELRQRAIDKAFENMKEAREEYEELVKKFKDKPATQITEVKTF